jgi:hypothetical protein
MYDYKQSKISKPSDCSSNKFNESYEHVVGGRQISSVSVRMHQELKIKQIDIVLRKKSSASRNLSVAVHGNVQSDFGVGDHEIAHGLGFGLGEGRQVGPSFAARRRATFLCNQRNQRERALK